MEAMMRRGFSYFETVEGVDGPAGMDAGSAAADADGESVAANGGVASVGVSSSAMPAAVFFDLDGTLIDSDPYWVSAQQAMVERCGGAWSDALAERLQGMAYPDTVRVMHEVGVDLDGETIVRELSDEVLRMEMERLPWVDGVRELLESLASAHVPCVLVTGSPRIIVENVIRQAPAGAFVGYVCGDDDVEMKPDPEPYWRAAGMAGLPADRDGASRCLIFEDSRPGLTAARASGAAVVAVTGHARVDMSGSGLADHVVVDYRGVGLADVRSWWRALRLSAA